MNAPGRIEFIEIDIAVPHDNEVLIEAQRIGVCGSDIHEWHGQHPDTSYPIVLGHEVSG